MPLATLECASTCKVLEARLPNMRVPTVLEARLPNIRGLEFRNPQGWMVLPKARKDTKAPKSCEQVDNHCLLTLFLIEILSVPYCVRNAQSRQTQRRRGPYSPTLENEEREK